MKAAELVVVGSFLNAVDGEIALSALEAAGIDATLQRDDCGGMRPQLWLSGVAVLVRKEDAERANEVLGSFSEADAPEPSEE